MENCGFRNNLTEVIQMSKTDSRPQAVLYCRFGNYPQVEEVTALYCRTALTDDERIAEQEASLRQYANSQGYGNCVCYRDNGESGVTLNRPAMGKLIRHIRDGRVCRVVVSDLARVARNCIEVQEFLQFLSKQGVELVTLDGCTYKSDKVFDELRKVFLNEARKYPRSVRRHAAF
jgi:DNA invertase Pin-like site-specific DNA recombinase